MYKERREATLDPEDWDELTNPGQPLEAFNDWLILAPLAGGDIMAIVWDLSANAISYKI